MEEKKVVERELLTAEEIEEVAELMESITKKGFNERTLLRSSLVMEVASKMLALASDLHAADVQVPWNSVCYAAHLPRNITNVAETRAALEKILGPLHIDISSPPENSRWQSKFPVLKCITIG